MRVAYRAPGFPEVVAAPGNSSFSRGFDNIGADLGSVDRLTPAPLTGINRIAEKFVGKRGVLFAATIATAAAAAASLVGGVNKAEAREGSPKVGTEISASTNGFEATTDPRFNFLQKLISGRVAERKASTEPGVQAFEVVASNDPIQAPGAEVITSLHGVQTYFNKNGNGMRVKFRENADGTYSVPIVRIGMTQDKLATASETEVFKAVQDALPDESGINTLNLGYVKGANFTKACSAIAGTLTDPEHLTIYTLQPNCTHPDTSPGFSARDVGIASSLLLASKITWYVRDQSDTVNFGKVPFWDLTYVNHSRKYDAIYSSEYFQRHLPIQTIGPGEYKTSPEPDSCREDCGTTPLFTQGQTVVLTARSNPNAKLEGWTNCPEPEGNVCKVDLGNIANDPLQPIKPITAEFVDETPPPKEKFKLTVRRVGLAKAASLFVKGFGITCPTDCAEILPTGTKEKLIATAKKGYEAYWKKCGGKVVKNACTLIFGKQNMTVEAAARKK